MHQSTRSRKNTLSGPSVQDIDTFRQRNFYQWVFTGPLGYCQSHSGWSFFGFLQREADILCIAATDGGDFYTSRIPRLSLEQALSRRMQTTNLHTSEPLLMSLLDLAAVDPTFLFTLPYRRIPSGLTLWEEDYTVMLRAQLASPTRKDDSELDLSVALFGWMDSEILIFLRESIRCPTLGEYSYLQAATDPEMRAQRMSTLVRNAGGFRRTYHPRFAHLCGRGL